MPQDKRIEFRVGIHVGDIIIEDSDIFGDGVNIAARLEGIAEPGGVCISGAAYDQVRDKVPFSFVDLGNQTLKNIARPVSVYGIAAREIIRPEETIGQPNAAGPEVHDRSGAPASLHSAGERGTRPSLAVLPFDNLGHDTEMEGFCDGLVEDAITALSRLRWLTVVSRNSSFAQKGGFPARSLRMFTFEHFVRDCVTVGVAKLRGGGIENRTYNPRGRGRRTIAGNRS